MPQPTDAVHLALPHGEHAPAEGAQACTGPDVSLGVAIEFRKPEAPVARRSVGEPATRVAMPKAAMHEDDRPVSGEQNIRAAGKLPRMQAVTEPGTMEKASDCDFRSGIASANA